MSKYKRQPLTDQQMSIIAPPYWYLQQQLNDGLRETRDVNKQTLEDFMDRATKFFDAITDVKVALGRIEILSAANGGSKTAAAMGKCAGSLMSAISDFQIEVSSTDKNPFAVVRQDEIQALVDYCASIRFAATVYVMATKEERSAIQNSIKQAVAQTRPLIASIVNSVKKQDHDTDTIAEMLITRLDDPDKPMEYKDALKFIKHSNPLLFKRVFADRTIVDCLEMARQIVHRYRKSNL